MSNTKHSNIPASYLVLLKDNKVLLGRRCNTGYEDGNYMLVAGHVEENESFTKCIIREAMEEIGIILKPEDLKVAHIIHRNSRQEKGNSERVDTFLIAEKRYGEIVNKELDSCDDLSWFDLDNLPENIVPYVKYALESIKNKVFYSELGWE